MSAPTFASLLGILYLGFGALGMLPSLLAPPPPDWPQMVLQSLYGQFMAIFPVNAASDVLHIAVGVWGLAAWAGALSAVTYARAMAALFAVLGVMGFFPGVNTLFGWMPLFGNSLWLNLLTAAAAGYIGLRSIARREAHHPGPGRERTAAGSERRRSSRPRRQVVRPTAVNRRNGAFDRRHSGGALAAG